MKFTVKNNKKWKNSQSLHIDNKLLHLIIKLIIVIENKLNP